MCSLESFDALARPCTVACGVRPRTGAGGVGVCPPSRAGFRSIARPSTSRQRLPGSGGVENEWAPLQLGVVSGDVLDDLAHARREIADLRDQLHTASAQRPPPPPPPPPDPPPPAPPRVRALAPPRPVPPSQSDGGGATTSSPQHRVQPWQSRWSRTTSRTPSRPGWSRDGVGMASSRPRRTIKRKTNDAEVTVLRDRVRDLMDENEKLRASNEKLREELSTYDRSGEGFALDWSGRRPVRDSTLLRALRTAEVKVGRLEEEIQGLREAAGDRVRRATADDLSDPFLLGGNFVVLPPCLPSLSSL